MDTAPKDPQDKATYFPKEPLDLPRPEMDLPLPEKELPSHAGVAEVSYENDQNTPYAVKTLLSWSAPGRPYTQKGKEYFASVILITLLLEVIIFLFGEYLLMIVVLSFVFVAFALAIVPPHNYTYKISTEGITIEDHYYLWQELYDFYFKTKDRQDILLIRTKAFLPGVLTIVLGDIHKEQVKNTLLPYLPYREVVQQTFMEKSGSWMSRTFPLEKTKYS
ncbi:MAG: hypothetical protein KBD46_00505 [Candidatus Levybacteria bacterium]|nr:hypothetical protein [Candidatus Levybacteria bacterium]